MGFVVDTAKLGQGLSEYFGFACHSFYWLLHTHYRPSYVAKLWPTYQVDLKAGTASNNKTTRLGFQLWLETKHETFLIVRLGQRHLQQMQLVAWDEAVAF
jgi:hypothetical protein